MSRKRAADWTPSREDEDAPEQESAPSDCGIASPEVLAKREFVKAAPRPAAPTGASGPNPFAGVKAFAGASSFGAKPPASGEGEKKPAAPTSFGFFPAGGTATVKSAFSPGTTSFSFGGAPAAGTSAVPPSFGFNVTPAAGASKTEENKEEGKKEEGKDGEAPKPVFASGVKFNFGSAVTSFVEGRKMMQASGEANKAGGEGQPGASASAEDADDAPKLQPTESAVVVNGEVLAHAAVKMYLFKAPADGQPAKWEEFGAGDAKVKHEKVDGKDFYRITVRDGRSLNNRLGKGFLVITKEDKKYIAIAVSSEEGVPATYMLKFTGQDAETHKEKFTAALKKAMEDADAVAK